MTPDIQIKSVTVSDDLQRLRVFIRPGGIFIRRNMLTPDEGRAELFGRRREVCGRYYCQLQTVITFEEIKVILRFVLTHPGWLWRKWRAVKKQSKIKQNQ